MNSYSVTLEDCGKIGLNLERLSSCRTKGHLITLVYTRLLDLSKGSYLLFFDCRARPRKRRSIRIQPLITTVHSEYRHFADYHLTTPYLQAFFHPMWPPDPWLVHPPQCLPLQKHLQYLTQFRLPSHR